MMWYDPHFELLHLLSTQMNMDLPGVCLTFEVIVLSGQEELVGSLQHRIIVISMSNDLPDDLGAIPRVCT